MTIERVQRKREKGWRKPLGSVYVGRPSRWGNPFRVWRRVIQIVDGEGRVTQHHAKRIRYTGAEARDLFRVYAEQQPPSWLDPLRDATALVCWCPLDQPCHADVLIELIEATS